MIDDQRLISLSALQHYAFCPRQCALIHNEQLWTENYLTAHGQQLHQRVDSGAPETRAGIRFERAVQVSAPQLGLVGKLDLIEIEIASGKLTPVEYKRGKAKQDDWDKILQVPIHSIGSIFCFGYIMVSPQLMGFCAENSVNLAFFTPYGRFLARIQGKQSGNVLLRQQQFFLTEQQKIQIAKHIIVAKVQSSKVILQRQQRNHGKTPELSGAIKALNHTIERLTLQTDLDVIRGLEGEAASRYFGVFNQLLTKLRNQPAAGSAELTFNGRTRRPAKDPINAMLSFLYSIYSQDVSAALQGVGLDPQVGFLHTLRPGRDSLALDLLEEFRAYIIDRVVITLVNRGQVKTEDFITEVSGAVTMKDDTRKLLLKALQDKKQEKMVHPFLKEEIDIGLLPHVQAMLLARYIRGDLAFYPPFCCK